tara:strand:- start:472 stop:693 length:222 start_codon:yes stop_codon:yes gene_type:complete
LKNLIKIFIFCALIITSTYILGQPGGGGPPGGPSGPPCWPPPCVPVDGGISILVAIGAFFGGKSFYDFLKNKS